MYGSGTSQLFFLKCKSSRGSKEEAVSPPGCGPGDGGWMGSRAALEVCVSHRHCVTVRAEPAELPRGFHRGAPK